MKLTFDQVMIVLAGLTAGCERSSPQIVPEKPAATAGGASAEPEADRTPTTPPPPKAAPTGSTVLAKEIAPAPSARSRAPAGSAAAKEKGCAPGGCAPGKCG